MSGWTDALDGQERFNLRTENKELKAKLKALEAKPTCTHEVYNEGCEVCVLRHELKDTTIELMDAKHWATCLREDLQSLKDHYDWSEGDGEDVDAIKNALTSLENPDLSLEEYKDAIQNNAKTLLMAKVATGIRRMKKSSKSPDVLEEAAQQVERWMHGYDQL